MNSIKINLTTEEIVAAKFINSITVIEGYLKKPKVIGDMELLMKLRLFTVELQK